MNTQEFFNVLTQHAASTYRPASIGARASLTYSAFCAAVKERAAWYEKLSVRVLLTLQDNAPWAIVDDVAALMANVAHVPLPPLATDSLLIRALERCGVDTVIAPTAMTARLVRLGLRQSVTLSGGDGLFVRHAPVPPRELPPGTAKIVFNTDTDDMGKGICLGASALLSTAAAVAAALTDRGIKRHLMTRPLATLQECVIGVYASLIAGATCVALPGSHLGLDAMGVDPLALHEELEHHGAQSFLATPQALVDYALFLQDRRARAPVTLRCALIDGAANELGMRRLFEAAGLPVVPTFAVAQAASVVTMHIDGMRHAGSAGKALPHLQVRASESGELEVKGSGFLGYVDEPPFVGEWLATDKHGEIDDDGHVYLLDRAGPAIVATSRIGPAQANAERALMDTALFMQAAVFVKPRVGCCAVLWPIGPTLSDDEIQAAVDRCNARLDARSHVMRWTRAKAPFSFVSGLATSRGRPRRTMILRLHDHEFNEAIAEDARHEVARAGM
ncbi:AMP-binding protein [Achromobacter spanius]|uniref:AMP-dependent synthetase/ligase domain-containing protein n=1 Tax=Achromobacter spanius TaxID=217203 RepID=A0AAW3I4K6_9BURK|nr:AMP-binding protein [Achromobacter spanius]KNE27763.1 hypothetical protein AFM18_11060 [Achromobacter spanius]